MNKKEQIFNKARETIGDKSKLKKVVSKSSVKLKEVVEKSTEWKELKSKVTTLISMVQDHISGKYKAFSNGSILIIVFGLVYFITPTDIIPDFIPALGFTDDASVLFLIYRKLSQDIDKYLDWSEREAKER